ncbi:MAG: LysR family transcriptional regulator [Xanthobacteraceae bacterium]|nr:LysR family transcriptional regulator [Xanthobacteraceae bacterium]
MKLTQLEEFVSIADAGSIRAAARLRGLSQPAVTKNLRALERELGAPLVRRTARGVELTAFGDLFLMRARNVCRELERSRNELAQEMNGKAGQIAIGAAPGAAAVLLPGAIARLYRHSPDVELRIVEGMPHASLPRVRDGTFDFAIGPMPVEPIAADVAAAGLFRIEMAIVVRRGHPQAKARSVTALADYAWMTAGLSSERVIVDEMFRIANLRPPRWRIRCESISALIAVAARTDMIATIPKPLIELGIAGGLLEIVRLREKKSAASEVYLFTKRDSQLTAAAAILAKLLEDEGKRIR